MATDCGTGLAFRTSLLLLFAIVQCALALLHCAFNLFRPVEPVAFSLVFGWGTAAGQVYSAFLMACAVWQAFRAMAECSQFPVMAVILCLDLALFAVLVWWMVRCLRAEEQRYRSPNYNASSMAVPATPHSLPAVPAFTGNRTGSVLTTTTTQADLRVVDQEDKFAQETKREEMSALEIQNHNLVGETEREELPPLQMWNPKHKLVQETAREECMTDRSCDLPSLQEQTKQKKTKWWRLAARTVTALSKRQPPSM